MFFDVLQRCLVAESIAWNDLPSNGANSRYLMVIFCLGPAFGKPQSHDLVRSPARQQSLALAR